MKPTGLTVDGRYLVLGCEVTREDFYAWLLDVQSREQSDIPHTASGVDAKIFTVHAPM